MSGVNNTTEKMVPESRVSAVFTAQVNFLKGEILTIIDAALEGPQGKAVKDLIQNAVKGRIQYVSRGHGGGEHIVELSEISACAEVRNPIDPTLMHHAAIRAQNAIARCDRKEYLRNVVAIDAAKSLSVNLAPVVKKIEDALRK